MKYWVDFFLENVVIDFFFGELPVIVKIDEISQSNWNDISK
jgi:hypothetical protein